MYSYPHHTVSGRTINKKTTNKISANLICVRKQHFALTITTDIESVLFEQHSVVVVGVTSRSKVVVMGKMNMMMRRRVMDDGVETGININRISF